VSYEKSAQFYDLFDHKDNIEFYYHYASQAGEALDIGAGTGRIAIPLAERGVNICCIKPSAAMREEFEKKLIGHTELWEKIQIIPDDAAAFEIERSFPMAFLSVSYDHFVSEEERKASLMNIRRHLLPGGILVFDVFLGLMVGRPLSPAGEATKGSTRIRRFICGRVLTPKKLEVELVYEVYRGGEMVERINEVGVVGITNPQGVNRILEDVGFVVKRE
jgi:SAM-dependent methyltransferase